ncbi:MAG: discoidin domain-containing protein [Verrucomicrobiota bacterium]
MKTTRLLILALWMTGLQLTGMAETISLQGDWRCQVDSENKGATEQWFARELSGTMKLPGTLDEAGLGPKNTKPPTLEGPYRLYDYAGPAWYQRDIEIPAAWQGKRVTLFLERCRWVTTVWLDDKRIGTQDSLIAPHQYDFGTDVKPGKHRLTICVDNTVKINLGKFVSALFGGTWGNMNGIVGRMELGTTPPVWIEDLQVYPQFASKTVLVKGRLGNATGQAGQGTLGLKLSFHHDARPTPVHKIQVSWDSSGGTFNAELPITDAGQGVKLWDEFSPNMYQVDAFLNEGADWKAVSFGFRKFAVKGTQFTLNDRPVYLRGTLECSVFPLTGYPPTDVPAWQRIYRIMKSYGLNHIRFHSWCPPEAAFAAADVEGIIIQAEGPQANVNVGSDPARDAFIEAEFKRIVDTYGNHPSFCTMTLGNEYGGKDELLTRWVEMLIQRDPRHLYSSASSAQTTTNRQWTESPSGRGIPGAGTERDLSAIVAKDARPIIGHEIGQWMYFPDFNEMKKYTGVMAVKNFEMIRDDLEKKHLLDLAPKYVDASGRFATLLYKEEIEVLLRTPGYAGFSLLDLHDYPTQGTALIGPLDPFWESKGFITPEAYRRFCGATVPLLRMPKRTYASDEPFTATTDLAHYGSADLERAQPVWKITDAQGREIAAGQLPELKVPTGKLTALGAINASFAKVTAAGKLKVTISLSGTEIYNDWEIWVYPANVMAQPPANVVVCEKWDKAQAALGEGKKVVYFATSANTKTSMRGKYLPVFWSPVWFPSQKPNTMGLLCDPQHPLLAQFPTEFHSNWQWYELMQRSRLFILDETPADYRPLVQVIDNFARNHKLGAVFEGRVGSGQLLVCGFDLPAMAKDPAARQLLASLYQYVGSPAFAPKQELGLDLLEKLFVPKYSNQLQALGAKVRGDSQLADYAAEYAVDGDPNTMWHTPWNEPAPKFPHYLIVELPQPAKFAGLTCLPRQDGNRNGWIKDYAVHVSADGKDWGAPVAQGAFPRNDGLQTVKFAQPVTTRFLKFIAVSGFDATKPYASLAELDVIPVP